MKDANYLNDLHAYAEILEKIMTPEHMNSVCGVMLECFKKCNLKQISPLVLKNLALTICGKISICVNGQIPLGRNVLSLIDFLIDKDLVAKIFYSFICDQVQEFEKNIQTHDQPSEEEIYSQNNNSILQEALQRVLNICDKAEKYTKKHFGYSLLDLKGNFVWADKNSCNLLDLGKTQFDSQNINFFDLMIPTSKKYLHMKFGEELFEKSKEIGSSRAFSYVIYSKSAMQSCLRTFKKMNITNPNLTLLNSSDNKHMEIFTRYLKSLSSRASLIMLSFNKAEIQSLLNSDKCKMQISKKMVADMQRSELQKEDSQIYKLFIFLETRLSSVTPNFDYSQMSIEPRIMMFSQTIQNSLQQFQQRKCKQKSKQIQENAGDSSFSFRDVPLQTPQNDHLKQHSAIQKTKRINKKSNHQSLRQSLEFELSHLQRRKLNKLLKHKSRSRSHQEHLM